MGYIFISYSRRQLYFAESVALTLQRSGLEVWFDLQKLVPGVNWDATLKEGYVNCERLVLIASQAAIQSSYVKAEWESTLHNGREIILVLTEAVELPEALKGYPVYDARNRFDRTMESLSAYLCGESPARHDPVPAIGWFPYPLKMPSDIWLTLIVMLLPTLTAWIAVFSILPFLNQSSFVPDWLPQFLPSDLNPAEFTFLFIGILYGLSLSFSTFPLFPFWRHEAGQKKVDDNRGKLLTYPLMASLIVVIAYYINATGNGRVQPFIYLIFIFPLVTTYWSFQVWSRSPDILRWMPSGEADQEIREQVDTGLKNIQSQPVVPSEQRSRRPAARFILHYHPADQYNARRVTSLLQANGCQAVEQRQADHHIILVSNRTSREWLLEQDQTLPGRIIHILCTNINTPPELHPLLQNQWVDFRNGRAKTLRAFAAYLNQRDEAEVAYGMQVSPTGFDTESSFPPSVKLVAGFIYVITLLFILAGVVSMGEFKWYLALLGLPWVFYSEQVITRKRSLPARLHKILGNRLAWFAYPAPAAPDAIGNQDKKYIYAGSLFKPFWQDD